MKLSRLTQAEVARLLGVCERSFRRYLVRYEADGLVGLADRRLEQASQRQAPVDEVLALTERYRQRQLGWMAWSSSTTSRRSTPSVARSGWCSSGSTCFRT